MIFKPVYIGCRVSRELREEFKELAIKNKTTPSKILRKLIKKYMKEKSE